MHRNSDPAIVAQTLKVDEGLKRKFKSETKDKEGAEASRERKRHTKRFKALDKCNIISKKMNTHLPCWDCYYYPTLPNPTEGSTTGGGGSKVLGSSAPLFYATKWVVG